MAADSPSRLLQRAADELERLADGAQREQWWVDWHERGAWGSILPPQVCGRGKPLLEVTNKAHVTEVEWAATVSPIVAAPIVAWLREAAAASEQYGNLPEALMQDSGVAPAYGFTHRFVQDALEFARLILGEPRKD